MARSAFSGASGTGFGTKTDHRDLDGALVIAHDPTRQESMTADAFRLHHRSVNPNLPLAPNFNANGLKQMLSNILEGLTVPKASVRRDDAALNL